MMKRKSNLEIYFDCLHGHYWLSKFGRYFYVSFVSAGDDPDPLAGHRTQRFEDARSQSLFPCLGSDCILICGMLEVSGREYGNSNAGGRAERTLANLPGHHCSTFYLQPDFKDRRDGRNQEDACWRVEG